MGLPNPTCEKQETYSTTVFLMFEQQQRLIGSIYDLKKGVHPTYHA